MERCRMGLEGGNEAAIKASIVTHDKPPVHLDLCWPLQYHVEPKCKIVIQQVIIQKNSINSQETISALLGPSTGFSSNTWSL